MAVNITVKGLVPHRRRSGLPLPVTRYKKEAAVILGKYDPIVLAGSAEDPTGIPTVTRAGGTGAITTISGVMISRDIDRNALGKEYFASADTGYLSAVDADDILYWATEDGTGGFLALTDVGQGVDLAAASDASTVTGLSNFVLDSSTAGTSGVQLRLEGLAQIEGNVVGSTSTIWEVSIVERTRGQTETLI